MVILKFSLSKQIPVLLAITLK